MNKSTRFARPSTLRSRPHRRQRLPLRLEALEDRCLLAGTLTGVPFTAQPIEGTSFTGQVATVFDTGPLAPTFTIAINWGDGTPADTTSGTAGTANAALTAFEPAVGGVKNAATAPQTGGFRTITWDGVKTDGSDTVGGVGSTVVITPKIVGIPLNRFEGSGVYFGAVY